MRGRSGYIYIYVYILWFNIIAITSHLIVSWSITSVRKRGNQSYMSESTWRLRRATRVDGGRDLTSCAFEPLNRARSLDLHLLLARGHIICQGAFLYHLFAGHLTTLCRGGFAPHLCRNGPVALLGKRGLQAICVGGGTEARCQCWDLKGLTIYIYPLVLISFQLMMVFIIMSLIKKWCFNNNHHYILLIYYY
jgi:hypothetical protein